MKMILINGVTVRTLEDSIAEETVAILKTALPDANIVVLNIMEQNDDTPNDNPIIE
jgi:hypothetical protein